MPHPPDPRAVAGAAHPSDAPRRTADAGRASGLAAALGTWPAVTFGLLLSWCLSMPAAARQNSAPKASPPSAVPPPARPGPPPASPLTDLDRALLEGLPAATPPANTSPSSKTPPQTPPLPDTSTSTPSPATRDLSALRPIARQMLDVKNRLEKLDTAAGTQVEQARIIAQLRQLVASDAPSAPANSRADSAGSPADPDGASAGGPAQAAEPGGAVGQARGSGSPSLAAASPPLSPQQLAPKLWGHLPEKVREEMQSAFGESFVPKYERLIEQYYRRLAEQPAAPR